MTTIILELEGDVLKILKEYNKDVILTSSILRELKEINPELYDLGTGSGIYQQIERTLEKRDDVEKLSVIRGNSGSFRENGYRFKQK